MLHSTYAGKTGAARLIHLDL